MATKNIRVIGGKQLKIILLLVVLIGVVTGLALLHKAREGDSTPLYSLGESVQRNGFEITVESSRNEPIELPDDNARLNYTVVGLRIENQSGHSLPFIPVFQSFVRTIDGDSYDMSPLPGIQPIYAGDIQPGTTVRGELSYLVPNPDQQLMFFFDPGWNEEAAVFVKL